MCETRSTARRVGSEAKGKREQNNARETRFFFLNDENEQNRMAEREEKQRKTFLLSVNCDFVGEGDSVGV